MYTRNIIETFINHKKLGKNKIDEILRRVSIYANKEGLFEEQYLRCVLGDIELTKEFLKGQNLHSSVARAVLTRALATA